MKFFPERDEKLQAEYESPIIGDSNDFIRIILPDAKTCPNKEYMLSYVIHVPASHDLYAAPEIVKHFKPFEGQREIRITEFIPQTWYKITLQVLCPRGVYRLSETVFTAKEST